MTQISLWPLRSLVKARLDWEIPGLPIR